jgi:hypothetical protein
MHQPFDAARAIMLDSAETPPVTIQQYRPLAETIADQTIHPAEPCLIATVGDTPVVLPTLAMVYHHVAQGRLADEEWMAAFCCLCNAGSVFDPRYKDTLYSFAPQGYYDLMVLIADQETGSYWNHLTGSCLHGPLAGAALKRLSSLAQMRAGEAAHAHPNALLAIIEDMSAEISATASRWNRVYRLAENPSYGQELLATLKEEDTRRPRHDMGLGVWTSTTQRYYPITTLYAQQNVIIDTVDGRGIVVIFNDEVGLPEVFYADARHVTQRGQEFILDDSARYVRGTLMIDDMPVKPQRPHHNAIRWYAFSSIFPSCEVYQSA